MNAYEEVRYPCHAYKQTLPSHLRVIARLHGLNPAPAERCRVLEAGCGDGGNLLPMAWQYPDSEYVGIDLAPTPLEHGRKLAAEAGVKNLKLIHRDMRDMTADGGTFDYIIAHGFYSWVPDEARALLLELCRKVLSPHGVVFISYNAYPGAHVREMLRGIMLFHASGAPTAEEKVDQARAVAGLLADCIPEEADDFSQVLKSHSKRVMGYVRQHLYHDDLSENCKAFYLHEVVGDARAAGLGYLGDADFRTTHETGLPDRAHEVLRGIPDPLLRHQYYDFLRARRFRQTLLTQGEAPVNPAPDASVMPEFYFETARGEEDNIPPEPPETENGAKSLVVRIIRLLAQAWPERRSWAEVREAMAGWLAAVEDPDTTLNEILLEAYAHGMLDVYSTPSACTASPGEKPVAGALARLMLRHGPGVTTLLHASIMLTDAAGRHLVSLMDGTRDRAALESEMTAWTRENNAAENAEEFAREQVSNGLRQLTRLGLMSA